MRLRALFALPVFLVFALPAGAQTPPPQPGDVLNNPDAPRLPPPTNPTGQPPLPTIIPSTILIPGSGH